ncbi:hypothetical protein COU61_04115, partial [Candidatus Pacearchaeota archaeon CG10_big_fil_rev_8_21_14_0_10_35_13]
PTKPLVEQHLRYFRDHLPELFATLEIFTGATPAPQRKKLWQCADIIFSTPQCIDGQTQIFTEKGPTSIEEFFKSFDFKKDINNKHVLIADINEKVLGWSDNKIIFVNAIKALKLPSEKIISLKTELGNVLKCTTDHPLLSLDEYGNTKWVNAKNLKEGDFIASINRIELPYKPLNIYKLLKDSNLRIADKELTLKLLEKLRIGAIKGLSLSRISKFRYNSIPLKEFFCLAKKVGLKIPDTLKVTDSTGRSKPVTVPRFFNGELSYIVGAMLGDGHLGDRRGHGSEVVFSDLSYKSNRDNFMNKMMSVFGIKMSYNTQKGLVSYNSALSVILTKLGIPKGNKASIIRVPKPVFFSSNECIHNFIKGIFDSDGSAGKYNISISSVSKKFIEDLKWLFLRIGIPGRVERRKNGGMINNRRIKESVIYSLRFSGRTNLERFLRLCSPSLDKCKNLVDMMNFTKRPFTRNKDILPAPKLLEEIYLKNRGRFPKYLSRCFSKNNLNKIIGITKGDETDKLKSLLKMPFRWVRIKEIGEVKKGGIVYDFTIENDHNFITNSLVSHNCIANDIRKNLYNLSEVCLLVEDEAHRCIKNYDYTFVARHFNNVSSSPHVLGLTASPGSDKKKIMDICKNLGVEALEVRTRDSSDVKPYLQELKRELVFVDFPQEFLDISALLNQIFLKKIQELKNRHLLFRHPSKVALLELQKSLMGKITKGVRDFQVLAGASTTAQALKISHALELLETQTLAALSFYYQSLFAQASSKKSKAVQNLIKIPEFNASYTLTQELLSQGKEHPKLFRLKGLVRADFESGIKRVMVFTQFRDSAVRICRELNSLPLVNASVFVGQAKKKVGSVDESGLSQKEQKQLINNFVDGKLNVLVSTSVHPEEFIIVRSNGKVFVTKIGAFVEQFLDSDEMKKVVEGFEVLSTDGKKSFFRKVTHVHRHISKNNCARIKLSSGFDCLITKDHSLFSFNKNGKFVPAIPEKSKFVALPLKCQTSERMKIIDVFKELRIKDVDHLFGTLDGLTQARIRLLKSDFDTIKNIDGKKSILGLSESSNRDYGTISRSLIRLLSRGFISQKRVNKNYKKISSITPEGVEYLSFLRWFFSNVSYHKHKYRFRIDKPALNHESFVKFFPQKFNVNYGKITFPRHIKINDSLARFLGFYVSEGHVRKTKYTSEVFLAAKKREMQEMMIESIKNGLGLKHRQNRRGIAIDAQIAYYLIRDVLKAGIGAYNKEVPEIIFTASDNIKWEFIRAYCLGDGHIAKDKIVFTTVSRKLVVGMVFLLRTLGISKITLYKQNNIYRINIFESLPFATIKKKGDKRGHTYYSLIPNALSSVKAFEKFGNSYEYNNGRIKCRSNGFWKDDISYDFIKEIELLKEQPRFVYDLSVEGSESFMGGTGLTALHNSIGEEGLDIPEVGVVYFYEPIPSAIRKIQRGGRTARLMPGKIVTLITKGTRDEAYHWSAFHKEKKMSSALDSVKDDFDSGLIDNKSSDVVKDDNKNLDDYK